MPNLESERLSPSEWISSDRLDARKLRDLFSTYLTGVTVVTTRDRKGSAVGFTANSFTSVSLEPPLILVCVSHQANSHQALCSSDRFAVNILSGSQKNVSAAFASSRGAKFSAVETWSREGGPAFIKGVLSAMECETQKVVEAGDHSIVVGRVVGFQRSQDQPLGFFAGAYASIEGGADVVERLNNDAVRVGCLIESDGHLLLLQQPRSTTWEIPSIPLRPGENHRHSLPRFLDRLRIQADVTSLFSVFQDAGHAHTMIVFRGEALALPLETITPDGYRLRTFPESEVPFADIAGRSTVSAIQRFFRERAQSRFGIYWDTQDGGHLAPLDRAPTPWERPT